MCGSVLSTNVSAQSPPCSRNASPRATSASRPLQPLDLGGHRHRRHALQHRPHRLGLIRRPSWAAARRAWPARRPAGAAGRPAAAAAQAAGRWVRRRSSSPVHGNGRRQLVFTAGLALRLSNPDVISRNRSRLCLASTRASWASRGRGGIRGRPAVLPELPQLAGEARDRRRQVGHRPPQLAQHHVVVGADPGPQLDRLVAVDAEEVLQLRSGSACASATAATTATAAWAAHACAPSCPPDPG